MSADMNVLELRDEDHTSFKFPFTGDETSDLNLSNNYKARDSKYLPAWDRNDSEGSSSDFGCALSPIARNRDSGASYEEYFEGESLVLVDSENSTPKSQSGNDMKATETSRKDRSNIESSEMPLSPDHPPSHPTDSLQSAMKQVGERSSNFIDKIRDAAQKRKVAVTRSRDSLVAKEQEQLRSIAECQTRFATLKQKLQGEDVKGEGAMKENNMYAFRNWEQPGKLSRKTKNIISKNGCGAVGVPKVEKRPTTTPKSPMLGRRRKGGKPVSKVSEKRKGESQRGSVLRPITNHSSKTNSNGASANSRQDSGLRYPSGRNASREFIEKEENNAKWKSSQEEEDPFRVPGAFKARPDPSSTTRRWNAGQLGIPKVSKRALTVPVSPCLGPKRQPRTKAERGAKTQNNDSKFKIRRDTSEGSGAFSAMSPLSVNGSPLIGLTLLNSTGKEQFTIAEPRIDTVPQKRTIFKPFALRSTNRANMRKQYDIARVETRALSLQEKRERLRSEIKAIHRELKILSKDLT